VPSPFAQGTQEIVNGLFLRPKVTENPAGYDQFVDRWVSFHDLFLTGAILTDFGAAL
jgi:hypothetical protein